MELNDLQVLLAEENWSPARMLRYTPDYFDELDKKIDTFNEEDLYEAKAMCDEHVEKIVPNSVVARYLSGIISLRTRPQEDNFNFLDLISSFVQVQQWQIVDYLCAKVLAKNESKHALRFFAQSCEAQGKEDEKIALWRRLVKVDFEETTIVMNLAKLEFAAGHEEEGIAYLKKGINRFINNKDSVSIKANFPLLIEKLPGEFSYMMSLCDRVASRVGKSYAVALLNDLQPQYRDDVDKSITIYKKILTFAHEDQGARKNLIEAYKKKYSDHGRLNTCLVHSKLDTRGSKDILHAIEDFETDIAFDRGTFVFQKSTGRIGRIRSIDEKKVIVDFAGQKGTAGSQMTTSMAFRSLQALSKSHIWVLKSALSKEKLSKKFISDVNWGLNILMSSNGDKASLKEMKAELVPDLLTPREWTNWSNEAKKMLMSDPLFGVSPNDPDVFILRSTPITYEEKQLNIFKGEKYFYDKVKDMREFILNKGDVESDSFLEMVAYFYSFITNSDGTALALNDVTDTIVSSYMQLELLYNAYNMSFIKLPDGLPFEALYSRIDNKIELFCNIKDNELKKCFIKHVEECDPDWEKTLLDIFPYFLNNTIPNAFRTHRKTKDFTKIFRQSVDQVRDMGNVFIYLHKEYPPKEWAKAGISEEQMLFAAIQHLDYALKCISNKSNVTENRKNAKILSSYLFESKTVYNYIENGDEDQAKMVYSLIADLPLDAAQSGRKIEVKHQISTKYPGFDFSDEAPLPDRTKIIPTGLFCLQASLDKKKAEMYDLQHVQIPENSKEIGIAREMGDLRENSEYKYGKERQRFLSAQLQKLSGELDRAQVVKPEMVKGDIIEFGTRVTLHDNLKDKDVVYTVMGPWESDPNNNVINMVAPLGQHMLNHKVGETLKFTINETEYDFSVLKIEAAI
ncbi:MAG: GreA/GreB family elongation factor [Spirochaetia bacterium]|nr:GreA/GreB family elongation factor [Spirochaetia bacterium]